MHLLLPRPLLGYFSLAYIVPHDARFLSGRARPRIYVLTARIKGASELRVLLAACAAQRAGAHCGTVSRAVVWRCCSKARCSPETVFSWPGIGLYITNALFSADLAAVLGGTLLVGVCLVILNTASDLFRLPGGPANPMITGAWLLSDTPHSAWQAKCGALVPAAGLRTWRSPAMLFGPRDDSCSWCWRRSSRRGWRRSDSPTPRDINRRLAAPGAANWLGTDQLSAATC
jgi:hypothetical protein